MPFIYFLGFVLYFMPTIIVVNVRKDRPFDMVFGVNLLLGWTVIGWVYALMLATERPEETNKQEQPPQDSYRSTQEPQQPVQHTHITHSKSSNVDLLERLARLRREGVITPDQFEKEKKKLLGG